ncbi:MAG: IS1380 family transposase [Bacteroidales bacterium]|nr:IS1380 family transposase [Bacteroidales bacterium]
MSKDTKSPNSDLISASENFSTTLFDLSPVCKKTIELSYTAEKISSDGGLLLLREVENQSGILKAICNCIEEDRHPGYIKHSINSMLTQRVFQIAAGYEDANDCDTLRDDMILKICADVAPESGTHLSSQPTMSRFENSLSRSELYKIAVAFVDHFIRSYTEEPPMIILDCDDTNSNTYGAQQLALFNNYYDEYCYMPLHIYEGLSGKLITTILKPGRRSKTADVFSILSRIIVHLRKVWKNTIIIVRGDGHFCSKELMAWTKGHDNVHFLTGLTGNPSLNKLAGVTIDSAEKQFKSTGEPVKRYHSFDYAAGSWSEPQRVIVKVEVSEKGTNIRYVVTDIRCIRTRALYEQGYCARGQMELYIKESKTYLESDRMSCSRFEANQFRLFMHSAAYVLLHILRSETLRATQYATATMKTIRLRLIKIAAYVKEMKTRIKIEFPKQFPDMEVIANCLGIFTVLRC